MQVWEALLVVLLLAAPPTSVSFPAPDGGVVSGDLYGGGEHGVVLVHGGRFDRTSWAEQAPVLAAAGLWVLAIDLRGKGESRGPAGASSAGYAGYPLDVLGAVRYLRREGAETVSVVGGSLGGWAAARAAVLAEPGEIDRLVLLAHSPIEEPEKLGGRKLFITARDDAYADGTRRLVAIRDQYERAPEPKQLLVLDGSAHAQFLFGTDQGEPLLQAIVAFLTAP